MGFDQQGKTVFTVTRSGEGKWDVCEQGFTKALASFDREQDAKDYANNLAKIKQDGSVASGQSAQSGQAAQGSGGQGQSGQSQSGQRQGQTAQSQSQAEQGQSQGGQGQSQGGQGQSQAGPSGQSSPGGMAGSSPDKA